MSDRVKNSQDIVFPCTSILAARMPFATATASSSLFADVGGQRSHAGVAQAASSGLRESTIG
jgi:hypothetical protein